MDVSELVARNVTFEAEGFVPGLSINPSGNTMVVCCVDPRVDPTHVLGLVNGEAAVIRNVGGRVTPATLRTMTMLARVGAANPEDKQPGDWDLVLMHHTDCGMTDLAAYPDLLADYFEVDEEGLADLSVSDPVGSVGVDVEVVQQALAGPGFRVTGLVYDVATGRVDVVVPPAPLRRTA